jgi:hypothetical protein
MCDWSATRTSCCKKGKTESGGSPQNIHTSKRGRIWLAADVRFATWSGRRVEARSRNRYVSTARTPAHLRFRTGIVGVVLSVVPWDFPGITAPLIDRSLNSPLPSYDNAHPSSSYSSPMSPLIQRIDPCCLVLRANYAPLSGCDYYL